MTDLKRHASKNEMDKFYLRSWAQDTELVGRTFPRSGPTLPEDHLFTWRDGVARLVAATINSHKSERDGVALQVKAYITGFLSFWSKAHCFALGHSRPECKVLR